uniref:F-box domain-containing protein n=1 Tax=Globodera rostochiensis TaxID=31243 RepID=A0A914GYN9_GLORO
MPFRGHKQIHTHSFIFTSVHFMMISSFSSSSNSYFSPPFPKPFVRPRPPVRRLPNELLNELAKFASYDVLEQSCTANARLLAVFRPVLQQKDTKLCSLYFDDVRSLSVRLKQWTARSDSLRKFVVLRASVDSKWCEDAAQAKRDLWTVNRARVTSRGVIADLRDLRALLDEFASTLTKISEGRLLKHASMSRDWPRSFNLGASSSARFRANRSHLIVAALAG